MAPPRWACCLRCRRRGNALYRNFCPEGPLLLHSMTMPQSQPMNTDCSRTPNMILSEAHRRHPVSLHHTEVFGGLVEISLPRKRRSRRWWKPCDTGTARASHPGQAKPQRSPEVCTVADVVVTVSCPIASSGSPCCPDAADPETLCPELCSLELHSSCRLPERRRVSQETQTDSAAPT